VSTRGLFLLFYVGITGLLSVSVFGLVTVRNGDSCFIDNVRLAHTRRAIVWPGVGFFFPLLLVFWLHNLVFNMPFCS
jgi:hypothetical protein